MEFTNAGWACVGGLVTLVCSVAAAHFASDRVETYYGKRPIEGSPLGYTSVDIGYAVEWGLAQFEVALLTFTGPIVVALAARNGANYWAALVGAAVLSVFGVMILLWARRCDGPMDFAAKNRVRRRNAKAEEDDPLVGRVDIWGAFGVAINVALILIS